MPYSLPENPTREVVKREYTIVNMRFKEFLSLMEPEHREFVSKELGYVKDYVENKNGVRINHAEISLMFAKEVMSKYRNEETAVDILVAHKLQSGLRLRFLDLRETDIKSLPSLSNLESMRTIYIESSIDFSNLELYNFILSITDHAITQEKIDRLIARYGENNIVIDDEHDEIRVTVLL